MAEYEVVGGFLREAPAGDDGMGALVVGGHRFSGGKVSAGGQIAASGPTTIVSCPPGRRLRVVWVSVIPSSDNTSANYIEVSLGAQLLYAGYAFAHWEVFEGEVDAQLVLMASRADVLGWTVHYEEIDA